MEFYKSVLKMEFFTVTIRSKETYVKDAQFF